MLKIHPSRLGEGPEGGLPPPSPPARTWSVSCWGRVRSTRPPRPLSLPSLTVQASLTIRVQHTQRTPVSPHPYVPPALIRWRCMCHDRASLADFGGRRGNGACSGGGDRGAVVAQCGGRCCHSACSGGSDRSAQSRPRWAASASCRLCRWQRPSCRADYLPDIGPSSRGWWGPSPAA